MTNEWEVLPLSEVVSLRRGHDLPARARRPGSIPVISSGDTEGWHDTAIADGPGVVLGRATNIGRPKWSAGPYWPHNTTLYVDNFMGRDPRWVFHLFQVTDLASYNSGSVQPMLNRNYIANLPIALPPLAEQKRIAAVLGAFDDLIEANRALVDGIAANVQAAVERAHGPVALSSLADSVTIKQVRPEGVVEHFSLPAFDDGATPEICDGATIKSGKFPLHEPTVLVARLNPKWERCWMAYPGANAMASTEFVLLRGGVAAAEEVWAVTSGSRFWDQMRARVTGTTGSHQRVDKQVILSLEVPDVRTLSSKVRDWIVDSVRMIQRLRDEIADLTRTRDELLPLLMSGRVRVREAEEVLAAASKGAS